MSNNDLCACGSEMLDGICLFCGWWPGRGADHPPGELIDGVSYDRQGQPMPVQPTRTTDRPAGVLLRRQGERSPEGEAAFAEMARERAEAHAKLPAVRAAGLEALKRLLPIAQGNSGQCRYVASFLLSLYNGNRFKFDLTDFRCLDRKIFNDCMAVLAMDFQPEREVHCYFENGGEVWEQLAKDWGIPNYASPAFQYPLQRGDDKPLVALRNLLLAVERCEDNDFGV